MALSGTLLAYYILNEELVNAIILIGRTPTVVRVIFYFCFNIGEGRPSLDFRLLDDQTF